MRMLLLVLSLLAAPLCAVAGNPKCTLEKYLGFSAAQVQFQKSVASLAEKNGASGLRDVLAQYLGDQLASIERRRIEFEFVWQIAPDKVRLDGPVQQWAARLESEDRARVAKAHPRYAELQRQEEAARNRPPHPDGDALRKVMRERVGKLPEYQKLLEDMNAAMAKANGVACG